MEKKGLFQVFLNLVFEEDISSNVSIIFSTGLHSNKTEFRSFQGYGK